MKRLEMPDAKLMIMALQDEMRRNWDSRYDHRIHAVLLVARGHICQEVTDLLGDHVRTVQSCTEAFLDRGIEDLMADERQGRPRRLSDE